MRDHFYTMLDAYQEGLQRSAVHEGSIWKRSWWDGIFKPTPVLQFGLAALLMLGGIMIGRWLPSETGENRDITELRDEMRDMKQIVTLSLLQQQSASERLSGLFWSQQLEEPDRKVLDALARALSEDPDVNVRLAAVDALYRFSDRAGVRESLIQTLPVETSPLVQIAVIDLLADLRERRSLEVLGQLVADSSLDPAVRERAETAMERISSRSL
jgi:hypothetical protein